MKKLIGTGIAAGIGVIGLTLVVPQAAYSAAPADHGHARYTLEQVAVHSTAADCWSVVGKKVYNLTGWLVRYPTQPIAVTTLCGKDSTAAFKALEVPRANDDDDDDSDDRSRRDRHGDSGRGHDDGDDDVRASASASASATTTASPTASATATTLPSMSDHGRHHGDNPWLKSIKRYKIGKVAKYATALPSASASSTSTATASASSTATATATPTATPTSTANGITLATVQLHKTIGDCWTIINGSVYNLTAFAPGHGGGPEVIAPACGTDGSGIFTGRHGTNSSKLQTLSAFKIGTLV